MYNQGKISGLKTGRKNAACAVNVPVNILKYPETYQFCRRIQKNPEKKMRMHRQEIRAIHNYYKLFTNKLKPRALDS